MLILDEQFFIHFNLKPIKCKFFYIKKIKNFLKKYKKFIKKRKFLRNFQKFC